MILPVTLVGGPLDGQELLYAEPLPASILAVNELGRFAHYKRRRNTLLYDIVAPVASRSTRTAPPPSKGTPSP